jgi:hypothetical protein
MPDGQHERIARQDDRAIAGFRSLSHQGFALEPEAAWKGKGAGTTIQVQYRGIARAAPVSLDEYDALRQEAGIE